jgi:C1A family cysteine protease
MELQLSGGGRRYGARRDTPDHRDLGMARLAASVELPSWVDLERWCGPVKDQGSLGACTAFAGCGMLEFLARKYQGPGFPADPVFSPLFLYYIERMIDGTLAEGDCGSTGRTLARAIQKYGVCLEGDDSYHPGNFQLEPTLAQMQEAARLTAGAYHRIGCVADMKSCLASGYVHATGFLVYESFEADFWAQSTALMPSPDKSKERVLGAHEVLFIGYDDARQAFKVRNSWGSSWGSRGNFWFPYAAAADPEILMDAWIQHFGPAWRSA